MRSQVQLREQASQQIARSFRSRIDLNFINLGNAPAIRDDNAVNRPSRRDRNIVNDSIRGVAEKFETGNKGKIEYGSGKMIEERRWMIEVDVACPSSSERPVVETFAADDACR